MRMPFAFGWLVVASALVAPAQAQPAIEVDVELIIAVDVSRSMSPRELEIQRRGYAEALTSDEVIGAVREGPLGRIALAYMEWAGDRLQRVIVDWTLISDRAGAEAFAARLTTYFDRSMRRTSISGALDFAAPMFDGNGFNGLRRVIDISGDGPNNAGRPVTQARDAVVAQGIVINGLPLMTREGMGARWHLDDLDKYYKDCVIGGAGAFVIPVLEWEHFPQAVRRKLVLELAGRAPHLAVPKAVPVAFHVPQPTYDCLIGEKILQQIQRDWD